MRNLFIVVIICFLFVACKKSNGNSAPVISYKSVNPNYLEFSNTNSPPIEVTFGITDEDGDIGFTPGKDTARIYIKNLLKGITDSLAFPALNGLSGKSFKADVSASMEKVTKCKSNTSNSIHIDTIYYEIYVKDFAKNKSNVIVTADPAFYKCF
jgi:hypothetical protein